MARPPRNNIDYFPHPVNHGKKMSYIEKKYKNDGYAVWMKLLEELGDNDYHYLNLSDEVQVMFLEEKCNVSQELLLLIISDLVKLGEFNKVLWEENQILFNEKFIDTIQDAYSKRNNKCISLDSLFLLLDSLGVRKPSKSNSKGVRNPQSKVEYSKVEETKVKNLPPTFEEFKNYALGKEPLIDLKDLELKYEAWKVNGWKTGKNTKIINWKSTLLNTIPHIKKTKSTINHPSILTETKKYEQF